jgi:leucine dehydrogenase
VIEAGPLFLCGEPRRGPVLAPLEVSAGRPAEEELRRDAEALDARCAACGVALSGGAARIAGPATPEALRAASRAVAGLGGRFYLMPGKTAFPPPGPFVLGHASGDPSPWTALGVFAAIRGGLGELRGARVAVLGCGRVGSRLVALLVEAGARVLAADVDPARAAAAGSAGAEVLPPADLIGVECDLLSPNARGFVFTEEEQARLRCRLIIGAQSVVPWREHRGIRAVPETLSGSGWLRSLSAELHPAGWSEETARRLVLSMTHLGSDPKSPI